jgi:hypothetical protein
MRLWVRLMLWSKSLMALSDRHCQQLVNVAMRHKGWKPVRRHHVNTRKG